MYRKFVLALALVLLFSVQAAPLEAFTYFGGKVTGWQEQTACPPIQAADAFLDAVCGVTGGAVCLNLEYGKLSMQGGFASPNAFTASFNEPINIGVLQLKDVDFPAVPLHFFQSFINYGFTQNDSWNMGEVADFTPSCNPCGNDLERKILSTAGVDMDKMCGNFIVKTALSLATKSCNIALAAASKGIDNLCPTKALCFVGSSHFGTPSIEFNLCHPGFSVGGFRL